MLARFVALAGTCAFLIAGTAQAQSAVSTRHWSGQGIAPVYEAFDINPDGTFNMWFGSDRVPAAGGDIVITPIIHASVQIEHAGTVIQIDPWSGGDLSKARPADLILVTDTPGHHLDVKAIERLRKPGAAVIIPANGKSRVPDGQVIANGETTTAAGVRVEATAAYDLKPGEPSHPKGAANGYVMTIGGKRILIAGVTECVPELRALRDIDVAFVPVNLPLQRMTPATAAECVKVVRPKVVYPYHYDQAYAARVTSSSATATEADSAAARAGIDAFKQALAGEHDIEVRIGEWYPPRASGAVR
jgi:L-ascorbate metabolism protein UlaG (beta-lactamase superfamily)